MSDIARAYSAGELNGWLEKTNPGSIKAYFDMLGGGGVFNRFKLSGQTRETTGKKMFLYWLTRKALGHDTKNYPQEIGDCFIAGTRVTMADGTEKPIENVQVGEMVLNHLNQPRRVTGLVRKKYTGDLVTIKAKGWRRSLTATATHKAIHLPFDGYRFSLMEFATKPFGEYEEGDYVLLNYGQTEEWKEDKVYDLALTANDMDLDIDVSTVRPSRTNGKSVTRFVEVNDDFGRLMGLYLAEGGISEDSTIQFSFCSDERDLIEDTKRLLFDIFGLGSVEMNPKDSVTCVQAYSRVVCRFIKHLIPGNVYSKNVPSCFFMSRKSTRKALLRGWMDGDGHVSPESNRVCGVSASSQLTDDMARLALSMKMSPRTMGRKREKHQRVASTQCDFYGTSLAAIYPEETPHRPVRDVSLEKTPFGFARKIKSVTRREVVDHDVYCLTVDGEHTLIVEGFAEKNCVSFGGKNATEHVTCVEMCGAALRAEKAGEMAFEDYLSQARLKFRPVFPPYYYGTGRVYVGGGRLGGGDGSLGSWMAEAVQKYGTVFSDEPNVPAYSGRVAKAFGNGRGLDEWKPFGQKYLVKSAALIKSWDDLVTAIAGGCYPCTTASDIGYDMEPSSDGFHRQRGSWGHQMCIVGVDETYSEPYGLILNSWGDVHGHLKDFQTSEDLPIGILRVRRTDIEKHIRAGETFAYSQFDGFPEQLLDKALFMMV